MRKNINIQNDSEKKPSKTLISVRKMFAIMTEIGFDIGRNDFFDWLREIGLFEKQGDSNLPTDYAKSRGLMKAEPIITTMITKKGKNYILDRYIREKMAE